MIFLFCCNREKSQNIQFQSSWFFSSDSLYFKCRQTNKFKTEMKIAQNTTKNTYAETLNADHKYFTVWYLFQLEMQTVMFNVPGFFFSVHTLIFLVLTGIKENYCHCILQSFYTFVDELDKSLIQMNRPNRQRQYTIQSIYSRWDSINWLNVFEPSVK